MRNNIVILAMFILVIVFCTDVLHKSLMENTNKMGLTLVENYCSTEESNMRTCEAILTISLNYIAEREKENISLEELKEGLYPFMNGLTAMYGADNIQIYGKAMGGTEVVSNIPQIEDMFDYNVYKTDYYQGAMEAEGEIYVGEEKGGTLLGLGGGRRGGPAPVGGPPPGRAGGGAVGYRQGLRDHHGADPAGQRAGGGRPAHREDAPDSQRQMTKSARRRQEMSCPRRAAALYIPSMAAGTRPSR